MQRERPSAGERDALCPTCFGRLGSCACSSSRPQSPRTSRGRVAIVGALLFGGGVLGAWGVDVLRAPAPAPPVEQPAPKPVVAQPTSELEQQIQATLKWFEVPSDKRSEQLAAFHLTPASLEDATSGFLAVPFALELEDAAIVEEALRARLSARPDEAELLAPRLTNAVRARATAKDKLKALEARLVADPFKARHLFPTSLAFGSAALGTHRDIPAGAVGLKLPSAWLITPLRLINQPTATAQELEEARTSIDDARKQWGPLIRFDLLEVRLLLHEKRVAEAAAIIARTKLRAADHPVVVEVTDLLHGLP